MYPNKPTRRSMSHLWLSWASFSFMKFGSPWVTNPCSANKISIQGVEWVHAKQKWAQSKCPKICRAQNNSSPNSINPKVIQKLVQYISPIKMGLNW